ncbi:SpoIVB peptidase [Salibacterium aidingense]|uniref:SpoIVB peptidase n=1 Tax=Salibacterium aidingense TaxID=384933 RepID=UPI003BCE3BF9
MDWGRKLAGMLLLVLFILTMANDKVQSYLQIPNEITTFESASSYIEEMLEGSGQVTVKKEKPASATVEVGGLPPKQTSVKKIPDLKVIPGGDSIGVKLQSDGVMIVGFHDVVDGKERFSPAKKAGLKPGDRIVEMNGNEIDKLEDVVHGLEEMNQERRLTMKIKRNTDLHEISVNLHQGKEGNVLGAYIRNAASGVGTLTFYEPEQGKFGSLGHVIADSDTKKPITVENGKIMKSSVTSIQRGTNGDPGEKQATLASDREELGEVTKNTSFGVFGKLDADKMDPHKPMPVAFAQEVKPGPAKMLTVIEDEKIEAFDIEIVQSMPQMQAASKGMVIKVKDEELLERTGGIIQGMSGSPIIQDGKIAGAVTHVFVNDSTSGYACHIEWMLEEAGIDTFAEERQGAA